MDVTKPTKIEEFVLKILADGPMPAMALVKRISLFRLKTTKQAVYAALRKLKKAETVVMHGKIASLNIAWISKMSDFFYEARHRYSMGSAETEGFLALGDGDKITYNFKNPEIADAFWGHAFDILTGVLREKEPVYIYNPHEWILLAREEQEISMFKRATDQGLQILVTTPGQTPLDKYVKKFFDGKHSQYYLTPHHFFKKSNYYLNIFSDYLIEVWIDERTHKEIDKFYQKHEVFTEEAREELKSIIGKQGRNKISISRNKEKAEKLKKSLGKEFYILQSK
jgi:hypothetical protein